jgi:hypothetical protein
MSYTLVQSQAANSGSSTVTSLAVTTNATGTGNLLVAVVTVQGSATATITPPSGWSQIGVTTGFQSGTAEAAAFYLLNSTGGVTSFTFTCSASVEMAIAFEEWSGVATSNALDQYVWQENGKTSAVTTGTTATLAQSGELGIWGYCAHPGTAQTFSSVLNGYVADANADAVTSGTSTLAQAALFYNTSVGTAGTSSGATTSGSAYSTTFIAAFKPASISPVLATSPTSLSFAAGLGGSNPASQNDTLSETAGVATAWTSSITYQQGSGWLSISPSSGNLAANGSATISFSCSISGLAAGTYNATVTFTATTGGSQATVTVQLVITAPALSTSPTSLSFSASVGGTNPASQNDTLSETAGVATAWTSSITYQQGSGWLSISPTSGNLAASGSATIAVSCTVGSLTAGTYNATVTFTATTGGATASIAVSFTLASPASPSIAPTTMSFTATVGGANPPGQGATLTNTGGTSGTWTANTSYGSGPTGWLSVNPSSGTLGSGNSAPVTVSCTVGTLPTGTYQATVTFSMGSNNATLTVNFTVNPATSMIIKLAGQDITQYVDQTTLHIDDTLGQGAGAGSSGATQGRATTIKFNTSLGPMNRAYGAGQTLPRSGGPYLVRQGEILVFNAQGTLIFGGYATKYTDTTTSKIGNTLQNFTTVEGIDYSTSLQRTIVYESFAGATDIQIIQSTIQKYTPWIKLDYLPTSPAYTFELENFFNVTVEQVLQTVAGITGYLIYIDFYKYLHYVSPTTASSAPFNLSDTPDFVTTFPHKVTEFMVDDNSAINRVFFYGGTQLSNNFTQDLSPLANGNNTVFMLAYPPVPATDGNYDVTVNGVAQAVGSSGGQGAANTLKSQGGTADCLIDTSARTLTFSTAPAAGSTVLITYRYEYPLSIVVTDENSHAFFGNPYLDGFINDSTVYDIATAIQRCKVLLAQQSFGLTTLKLDIWKGGLQAGMVIQVTNAVRGISGTYLVQEVETEPLGGPNFVYHLTLGAWNWGLIDFLLKLPTLATFQDDQNTSTQTVQLSQVQSNVEVHDSWQYATRSGPYYARATPVGDGHDAYPGFFTISS